MTDINGDLREAGSNSEIGDQEPTGPGSMELYQEGGIILCPQKRLIWQFDMAYSP